MTEEPSDTAKTSLLSRDTTALLLIDHQIGLLTGVRDMDAAVLKHNVLALTRAARVLDLPTIVTATTPDGIWGPTMPELTAELPDVEATGRRQLIIAGLSLEVCAAFPALTATAAGYHARVALDASGTFNEAKLATGLQRLTAAGIVVTDYATAMIEMLHDNADPKAPHLYAALDMPFAVLAGQLHHAANTKSTTPPLEKAAS